MWGRRKRGEGGEGGKVTVSSTTPLAYWMWPPSMLACLSLLVLDAISILSYSHFSLRSNGLRIRLWIYVKLGGCDVRIEERLNISGVVMELELGDDGVCRDVGW